MKEQSLFDLPTKNGMHHTPHVYITKEKRFGWQDSTYSSNAMYNLPTTIGKGSRKSFGTSTREDWNVQKKRESSFAGPGSYEYISSCGKQVNSVLRSSPEYAFGTVSRNALNVDLTPSPGPIYDFQSSLDTQNGSKFGTSVRLDLNKKSLGPGPNIALKSYFQPGNESVSPTFGTELRLRSPQTTNIHTPGPKYDLKATDFRTGSSSTFGKANRFK